MKFGGENDAKWLMLLKKHTHMHTYKYLCVASDSFEGPNPAFVSALALCVQHVNVKRETP